MSEATFDLERTMQLAHLEIFVAVARAQSFAEAARAANLAPSRVTERVRELETELRSELFDRSSRTVKLTQAGHALLPRAEAILQELDLIATLFPREHDGSLRVGLRSLPTDFREQLEDLLSASRSVGVTFLPLDPRTQTQMLLKGRLDFGVLWGPAPTPLRSLPILTETIGVAVPAADKFSRIAVVRPQDLAGLRLGSLQADVRSMPLDFAGYLDYLPNVDRINPSVADALYILVSGGKHCAFVPLASTAHASLSADTRRNILIKPLMQPAPTITSHLAWRTDIEATRTGHSILARIRRRFPAPDMR